MHCSSYSIGNAPNNHDHVHNITYKPVEEVGRYERNAQKGFTVTESSFKDNYKYQSHYDTFIGSHVHINPVVEQQGSLLDVWYAAVIKANGMSTSAPIDTLTAVSRMKTGIPPPLRVLSVNHPLP